MRPALSFLCALLLALCALFPCAAAPDLSFPGLYAGETRDTLSLLILPTPLLWLDERMGEEPDPSRLAVFLRDRAEAGEETELHALASPYGRTLAYEDGLLAVYACGPGDTLPEESAFLVSDDAAGIFTLSPDGTLLWRPAVPEGGDTLALRRVLSPAPPERELLDALLLPLARLGRGSAGYALRQARAVLDLFGLCSRLSFWTMEAGSAARAIGEAMDTLTDGERTACLQALPDLAREASRLLLEEEDVGGVYEDAGCAQELEALRCDASTRLSVSAFLEAAADASLLP